MLRRGSSIKNKAACTDFDAVLPSSRSDRESLRLDFFAFLQEAARWRDRIRCECCSKHNRQADRVIGITHYRYHHQIAQPLDSSTSDHDETASPLDRRSISRSVMTIACSAIYAVDISTGPVSRLEAATASKRSEVVEPTVDAACAREGDPMFRNRGFSYMIQTDV